MGIVKHHNFSVIMDKAERKCHSVKNKTFFFIVSVAIEVSLCFFFFNFFFLNFLNELPQIQLQEITEHILTLFLSRKKVYLYVKEGFICPT